MNKPTILQWQGDSTLSEINKILEAGGACAVDGMPNETYHAHKSASSSFLRAMHQTCPKKARHGSVFDPIEENKAHERKTAFDVGSAAHDYLLQREEFWKFNVVAPETYFCIKDKVEKPFNDKRGNKWKKLSEEHADKAILLHSEFEAVRKMVKTMDEHPFAGAAFTDGVAERSLFWVDNDTGVWCRARPDFLPNDLRNVPDYKTTKEAVTPENVKKKISNLGYNMQHAFYTKGIEAVMGVRPNRFFFVFHEQDAPHCITPAMPTQLSAKRGAQVNKKQLQVLSQCIETNHWPEYANGVISCDLPVWESMKLEEAEENGELPPVEEYWG